MPDNEAEQSSSANQRVTIVQLDDDGEPTARLGTATIIGPDAVIMDFRASTLPLTLGIIAPAESVEHAAGSRRLSDGSHLFNVMTFHVGASPTPNRPVVTGSMDMPEDDLGDNALMVALEIGSQALLSPLSEQHSARSFWCNLFPHLQACNRRR